MHEYFVLYSAISYFCFYMKLNVTKKVTYLWLKIKQKCCLLNNCFKLYLTRISCVNNLCVLIKATNNQQQPNTNQFTLKLLYNYALFNPYSAEAEAFVTSTGPG